MKSDHRFSQESENAQDDYEVYVRLRNTLSERGFPSETLTFESFQKGWEHAEFMKKNKDNFVSWITARFPRVIRYWKAPCRKCSKVLLMLPSDSEGMKLDWIEVDSLNSVPSNNFGLDPSCGDD